MKFYIFFPHKIKPKKIFYPLIHAIHENFLFLVLFCNIKISLDYYFFTQPCNCDWRGSPSDSICDVDNGNCICIEGFEGRRCDKCRFAHFQFPICRKCGCQYGGTEPSECTIEGLCQCDDNGQCPCKVNIPVLFINHLFINQSHTKEITQFICMF